MSIRPWRDIERRKSRQIMVGNVPVGGDAPVTVQTMTNTPTADAKATIDQIRRCEEAGADIVRVSCPDAESTAALKQIVRAAHVPIVADIHFHYKRALEAADAGAACLRINPGNIGSAERVREVVHAAKANGCAIRIGVNAGSLERDLLEKYGEPCPEALVESALDHIRLLEDHDFREYKVAVKASRRVPRRRRLSAARRSGRLPAPPRHHRGRRPARRHRQERDRHRLPALGRDRRHDPRLALGRARGGGARRLRDPEERSASATAASASSPARAARARASTSSAPSRRSRSGSPTSARRCRCRCSAASSTARARRARPTSASPAAARASTWSICPGVTDHHVRDEDMIDHIVRLVEAKAAEIEAARARPWPTPPNEASHPRLGRRRRATGASATGIRCWALRRWARSPWERLRLGARHRTPLDRQRTHPQAAHRRAGSRPHRPPSRAEGGRDRGAGRRRMSITARALLLLALTAPAARPRRSGRRWPMSGCWPRAGRWPSARPPRAGPSTGRPCSSRAISAPGRPVGIGSTESAGARCAARPSRPGRSCALGPARMACSDAGRRRAGAPSRLPPLHVPPRHLRRPGQRLPSRRRWRRAARRRRHHPRPDPARGPALRADRARPLSLCPARPRLEPLPGREQFRPRLRS